MKAETFNDTKKSCVKIISESKEGSGVNKILDVLCYMQGWKHSNRENCFTIKGLKDFFNFSEKEIQDTLSILCSRGFLAHYTDETISPPITYYYSQFH